MIKILILDDSKVIRTLLKMTLDSDGIATDLAATVDEAMHFAMHNEYDAMIIDYMLEDGRNGLELVEAIKSSGKNINTPTIMLSAEDGDNRKESAQTLGVKAWMKKPFTPPGMLKVVYRVLGKEFGTKKKSERSMHHRD